MSVQFRKHGNNSKHKQFVVIGMGRFGKSVARTLSSLGYNVLAIDTSETEIQAIANEVTHAVNIDAREEEALKSLGIRNFDVAVVAIGEDIQSNILVAVMLKELGVPYVVAKAQDALHGKVLERIGIDRVIYPEKDMGTRVAHGLVTSNALDLIELSPEYSIVEIIAPAKFLGKTLGELNLRAKYGVSVIAIKKGTSIIAAPGAEGIVEANDILIMVGANDDINRLPK